MHGTTCPSIDTAPFRRVRPQARRNPGGPDAEGGSSCMPAMEPRATAAQLYGSGLLRAYRVKSCHSGYGGRRRCILLEYGLGEGGLG